MRKQSMLLMVVVMACMSGLQMTYSIANRCRVHVINGFSTDEILIAHCKSKDDDLGVQQIPLHGDFQWTFRTDFFSRTKFNCHMWWKGGQKTVLVFWVNDKFIEDDCGGENCRWMSKDDGVYLFSYKHKRFVLKYKWDPWITINVTTTPPNSNSNSNDPSHVTKEPEMRN